VLFRSAFTMFSKQSIQKWLRRPSAVKTDIGSESVVEEDALSATDSAFGNEDLFTRIDFIALLPFELAVLILRNITDVHTLYTILPQVSRQWSAVSCDGDVWRSVYLRHWPSKYNVKSHEQEYYIPASRRASAVPSPNHNSMTSTKQVRPVKDITRNWKNLFRQRQTLHANWLEKKYTTTLISGHADSVYCIQFDAFKIVSGSRDCTIKFWNFQGVCLKTLTGHSGSVLCLQYNDTYLVSGSSDSTVIIWDVHTGACVRRLTSHTAAVLDIRLNDNYLVSCSKDTSICVWDLKTFSVVRTLVGHGAAVNAIHLHGNILASASGDCLVKLWNIETGQLLRDFTGHGRGLACVQFDGDTIISGSNDKTIRVWNAATGECTHNLQGHSKLVRTLCFDSRWIISGSYDESIKIWDRRDGSMFLDLEKAHTSWVFHVQIDPARVVSASQDKSIAIWDFSDGVECLDELLDI